jgi:hypothetical protein
MATPKNDTPEVTPAEAPPTSIHYSNIDPNYPRGDLIEAVASFVDERRKAEPIKIAEPDTGVEGFGILTPDGELNDVPASFFDEYRTAPRFRTGTAVMTSLDSFIAHVNRFSTPETALFACDSRDRPSLTAVLDYHDRVNDTAGDPLDGGGLPRFGRHRTRFDFPLSDEWQAWQAINGKPLSLVQFAEFIEDRIVDIEPASERPLSEEQMKLVMKLGGVERIGTPTGLFELSRGLHVNEHSVVAEARNLSSGEGEITFQEQHAATTDASGRAVIVPTTFILAIPVFKSGAYYSLLARLRYRAKPMLSFTVELWRDDRVFDHAFNEAIERAAAETDLPLFKGAPES